MKESILQRLEVIVRFCAHRRMTLNAIVIVITIWLLGGMLVLPQALQHFLTQQWANQIGHPVSVAAIRFHPWHWALTVEQFHIADSDATTLVSFDRLMVDYDMLSLFRLEFGLDAIEWQRPYVKLAVSDAGGFSVQSLIPPPANPAPPPEPVVIPSVLVKRIVIQELVVDYRDAQRARPFALQLDPVSFSLDDFHTRDVTHNNRIALQAHVVGDGLLAWEGQVRLEPLRVDGTLRIQDLALLPVLDFVQPERQFVLQSARLDMEVPHHVAMNDALSVTVQQARIALRDLRIGAEQQDEAQIDIPSIAVDGVDVDVQQQRVDVAAVKLIDGKIRVVRDTNGNINLQSLFAGKPSPNTGTAASATAPVTTSATTPVTASSATPAASPWHVAIAQLALDNYSVAVSDQTLSPPVDVSLSPIRLHASDIKPLLPEPMAVELSVGLPGAGELALQGTTVLAPLQLAAEVKLRQLPLALVQPYVSRQVKVEIGNGTLEAALKVDVQQKEQEQLAVSVSGSSAIRDLDIHEKHDGRKLVSWRAVEVAGIDYSLMKNTLTIDDVTVEKPYGRFIINPDGTTNIQQLLVQNPDKKIPAVNAQAAPVELPAVPAASATTQSSPPFMFSVKKVKVQDGDMGFSDLTLKPKFRVAIEKLKGTISDLSMDPAVMATVDLDGRVDRHAPARIHGTLNVFGKTPALDMAVNFKNIELTTFTPYSGTYAGFVIDKGQLSVDLDYKLINNRIAGKNRIVMNQLQLGQHVENDKTMDLPIRLALALLRDENGVIDLGFEVNGNVDEPSFSIGGLLLKVLGNVVMKAVTAPFSLFTGMVSAPEQSDRITFAAGSSALDELGASKVAAVASLLQKRATVHVNIRGNVLPEDDRLALQKLRLAGQLASETGLPAAQFLDPAQAIAAGAPRRLVGRHLHTLRNEELDDLEERIRDDRRARQQSDDKMAVKVAAYEQAWLRLAEAVPMDDADLKQLAMARASQVKTALTETHAIPPERVFVRDAANGDSAPEAAAVLVLDAD